MLCALWNQLPFVAKGVAGCGLYAVNRAGRARWTEFPDIHSDDKFVRLQFAPEERVRVDARYFWPVPEGLRNLVRVRRRWCEGNAELSRTFPQLMKRPVGETGRYEALGRLVLAAPFSAVVFTVVFVVSLMLALGPSRTAPTTWRRGR